MNNTNTLHAQYIDQKTKVERIKLDIVRINDELQTLALKLANAKMINQELTEQLQNASHNIALGKLTSEELLKLKQDLTSNDEVIKVLLEVISAQEAAKEIIQGPSFESFGGGGRLEQIKKIQSGEISSATGLYTESKDLSSIKQKLIDSIAEDKASNIPASLSGEIEPIIKSIVVGEKHQMSHGLVSASDIYQDLGKLLYEIVYPTGSSLSFEEVRKDYDEIINAM